LPSPIRSSPRLRTNARSLKRSQAAEPRNAILDCPASRTPRRLAANAMGFTLQTLRAASRGRLATKNFFASSPSRLIDTSRPLSGETWSTVGPRHKFLAEQTGATTKASGPQLSFENLCACSTRPTCKTQALLSTISWNNTVHNSEASDTA